MRPCAAAAALLLLAACTTRWERPGTGEQETALFEEACRREAASLAPPALVQRLVAPARVETFRDCRQAPGGRTFCTVSQRYVPPVIATDDLNAPARAQFNAMCMTREGFVANGVRPLRLF
jgi:hypothetical protein